MGRIAENLNRLMKEKGISVLQLAKESGWTKDAVYRWKNAQAVPNANALYDVAKALGVKIGELYGED